MNRSFACDTNSGVQQLVGSFAIPFDVAQVSGNEVVVDLGFAGNSVPSWWQFKSAGSCRQTSLSYVTTAPASAVNCPELSADCGIAMFVSLFMRNCAINWRLERGLQSAATFGPGSDQ